MGTVKTGDRVRITIEGTLEEDERHDNTHMIAAGSAMHYVYLHDLSTHPERRGLTVEKLEPEYEPGNAYMDEDDYVFIHTRDGKWLDQHGAAWAHNDDFIAKPLRKLVPESA